MFRRSIRSGLPFAVAPSRPDEQAPSIPIDFEGYDEPESHGGTALAWLVGLITLAVWWPLAPSWQSDDWIAVQYASDWGRTLHDFAGNQYGLEGLVWFYRPMVTLGFAIDYAIGGTDPFGSHLANAIAQALASVLIARLAVRFLSPGCAAGAALLWATAPLHAGTVLWAVGRVDGYTVPWILLAAWFAVRFAETGSGRLGMVIATVFALASKELAIATPGIAALLAFAAAPRRRWRRAWQVVWPLTLLVVAYLSWRFFLFDRLIGGYGSLMPGALELGRGIVERAGRILSPMSGMAELPIPLEAPWDRLARWAGLLPFAIGAIALVRARGLGALAVAALLFVGSAVPMMQFWASSDSMAERYMTLPSAALLGVIAAGGRVPILLALVFQALPLMEIRQVWDDSSRDAASIHRLITTASQDAPDSGSMFLNGLPRTDPSKRVILYHIGVDRVTQPPFGTGKHRLFALRPLLQSPDAIQLDHDGPIPLPAAQYELVGAEGIIRVPPPSVTGFDLAIDAGDGAEFADSLHVDPRLLWDLHEGRRTSPRLRCDLPTDLEVTAYRVTMFTANGYLCAVVPAVSGQPGSVSFHQWLLTPLRPGAPEQAVITEVRVPASIDLVRDFPVWVEAGTLRNPADPHSFAPRAAARNFVDLRFDPDFAEFVAGRIGDPAKTR